MLRGVLCALAFAQAFGALPVQNTVTTSTLYADTHFDRILTIGAAISRDNGDKYATLGGMLWGSWELLTEWINIQKGGISVGSEKWGIQIVEVEDYSNVTMASYAATQLTDPGGSFNVDFMFGPYSSGLTGPVLDITDPLETLLLASGSNQATVWDGNVEYGYGLLYPGGGYFDDSLALYAQVGATTAGFICNSASSANTCDSITPSELTSQLAAVGITLTHYYSVNSDLATYATDLAADISTLASEDVDVLILNDYYDICVDGLSMAVDLGWTPKGTYLAICNNDADALVAMGTNAWYAGTYTAWDSQSTYTSGISGYSVSQFATDFETEFDRLPTYQAAASFAAGEVLVSAIETQAGLNATLAADSATLAALIAQGSYSTVLSATDITFDSNHQAVGEWITLQYNNILYPAMVTSSAPLVYPQPAFSTRATTTTDDASADDDSTCVSKSDLAITGTMSFMGGMALSSILLILFFPKFLKRQQQGMVEYPSVTGTAGMEMKSNPGAFTSSSGEVTSAMYAKEDI